MLSLDTSLNSFFFRRKIKILAVLVVKDCIKEKKTLQNDRLLSRLSRSGVFQLFAHLKNDWLSCTIHARLTVILNIRSCKIFGENFARRCIDLEVFLWFFVQHLSSAEVFQ